MHDRAKVTIRVAAPREIAFEVFTAEIDGWWRHGRKYRCAEPSTMALEPRAGGRLTETFEAGGKVTRRTIGEVLEWSPPKRLIFTWRAANFEEADPSTVVEVTFERAIGHSGEGTLVTLEHRDWSRVRPDHPARHGQAPDAFLSATGRWWGDLLTALRERLAMRSTGAAPGE